MQNFGAYTYANADPETGTVGGVTIDGEPGDLTRVRYAIHYMVEKEGIYVGYKYCETRYEDAVMGQGNASGSAGVFMSEGNKWNYSDEVNYPFGYGLSYTTFEQELLGVTFDAAKDSFTVRARVTNTGDIAGKEVVQVYGQQPYTQFDKENAIEKASVQLVGFGKTKELAPDAEEIVEVKVERKELASYDAAVNKTYILESGDYYLSVGANAHDALNNILAKKGFGVKDGIMTSFNRIGCRRAGAHKGLLTNVLRNEWGFRGVVLTDAVMANRNWMDVSIGVEAGNDTWLSSGDWLVPLIQEWAQKDSKLLENLRTSCHNFLFAYVNSTALNGIASTDKESNS